MDDKDPPSFREKFKCPPSPRPPSQKILLKTSWTLISKKVGEFEQFSGAEYRLKGPFLLPGPEVPDLTPQ